MTLAAPAQKAQLSSTRVVREVCFGSLNPQCACSSSTIVCFEFCLAAEFSKSSTWGKGTHSYFMSWRICIFKYCAEFHVHASSICLKHMLQSNYPMCVCVCCLSSLVQSSPITSIEIQVWEGYPVYNAFEFKPNSSLSFLCVSKINWRRWLLSLSNSMWIEPSKN